MKKAVLPLLVVVSCATFVALPARAQPAANPLEIAPKDILTGAIDSQAVGQLPSSVHPKVRREYDAGSVPLDLPISRMTLVLRRGSAQQAALDSLVAEQQDPKSANYRKWLTPEEFGSHFGLSQNDLNKITEWLKQSGFVVNEVPKGRWSIIFSGTAGQVETAFHTRIHYYDINGTRHRANSTLLQIPQALAPVIAGILGIHDFQPVPLARRETGPQFANGSAGPHYLFPSDYATIYDLNPLYSNGIDGSGQTIAIVGDCNIDPSIVQTFRSLTGLPPNNTSVTVVGEAPPACTGNPLGEPYLDVEWSGAVAPNASIVLVVGTNIGDAATYIVDNNLAPVMSTSFGYCEAQGLGGENRYWMNLWEQASSNGITSLVSAGDSGAAACDDPSSSVAKDGLSVNGICSTPYDVCVGGTEFNDVSNPPQYWSTLGFALGYIPEEAWNESGSNGGSDLWATGGGYSTIYPISTAPWQTGNSSAWRGVPDVSLTSASHDGYFICEDSGCNLSMFIIESGTSASSPSFAGIMALVVEYTGNRQGAAHPLLYALASRADVFHDIVLGNNSVPGQAGYSAAVGWDPVTGLGSVDANSLVTNWGLTSTDNPAVLLSSTSINFGNQLVGSVSSSQAVTMTNNGNAPLNISAISVQGANSGDFPTTTTCQDPGTLAAGQSCFLTITFEPTAAGVRTASITISDNAAASPQTISLSGTGTSASTSGPNIIPIGSPLTFGGTNVPDTYSAQTTFSSTPVLVDNGAVMIWQKQVPTGADGEWDLFYMQIVNGGPLAGNINGDWNITMDYNLSAAASFDAVVQQWVTNGTAVGPLTNGIGSICCAEASNPIVPGWSYYASGFSTLLSAGTQTNWQQIYVDPYSLISDGGINPSSPNEFIFGLHFTLQPALPTVNLVISASAYGAFPTFGSSSWIEIYGTNLGVGPQGWSSANFNGINAPTTLAGTSVTIGGQSAFVDYVNDTQVNVQVPAGIGTGAQNLIVTTAAGSSAPFPVTVVADNPGLLAPSSFDIGGTQYVVAQSLTGEFVLPAGAISGVTSQPAKPGQTIVIYGIGFGSVTPTIPPGQLAQGDSTLALPFTISIGGKNATVSYDGLSPDEVGVYQFDVVVPDVAAGDKVPVTFTLGGVNGTQQNLFIAVGN